MFPKDLLNKYSMVVVFVALLSIHASSVTPPPITFICDQNGFIQSISKPNGKIAYILFNDGIICSPTDLANLNTCGGKSITNSKTLKLIIEDESHKEIVGGQDPAQYELSCDDGPQSVTATAKAFTVTGTKSPFKGITSKFTPALTLVVLKNKTDRTSSPVNVHIGDELYLVLSTSDGYKVSPSSCKAISSSIPKKELPIWNSCDTSDASLIQQSWDPNLGKEVTIKMYAFRFIDSSTVTISCTAMVCPTATSETQCRQACVTTTLAPTSSGKRRRRAIQNMSHEKVALATFTVSSPYKANSAEGLYGNSVKRNLIVSLLISVLFVLIS